MLLGNLNIKQIEDKLGIDFPDSLKSYIYIYMKSNHQSNAENIKKGKWHCFDIPFVLICGDKDTASTI